MTVPREPGAGTEKSLPTGDQGVDALIAMAAQTAQLPADEHKALYSSVLAGLEQELNTDPQTHLSGAAS
ncbi:hypothetical protein MB46_04250 [Arthrobacter alpinus]|uniref:hypothetical protein n=1 Tax=Arthrobacter alpinus TaxID=656366 RepID=UPI0005C8173B|nr:hypothetical protein [Arthrobacter alpinus]ALV44836.1 hypothetical protein MB46_04250 [Arthrobacter alpinus]